MKRLFGLRSSACVRKFGFLFSLVFVLKFLSWWELWCVLSLQLCTFVGQFFCFLKYTYIGRRLFGLLVFEIYDKHNTEINGRIFTKYICFYVDFNLKIKALFSFPCYACVQNGATNYALFCDSMSECYVFY